MSQDMGTFVARLRQDYRTLTEDCIRRKVLYEFFNFLPARQGLPYRLRILVRQPSALGTIHLEEERATPEIRACWQRDCAGKSCPRCLSLRCDLNAQPTTSQTFLPGMASETQVAMD